MVDRSFTLQDLGEHVKFSFQASAVCCLLFLGHAHAQSDNALEHVLVTDHIASQRSSITDVNLDSYTGFVRLINREDFSPRYTDFGELLDELPGIQVKQSGGFGAFSSVSVRGSTGKQVNVFLDGLLLNSPNSGSANINTIPTVLIERVEAYPDFTPAQLGNANLAGAINFKTRTLEDTKPGGQLRLAYGSFNSRNVELSAWGNINQWQLIGGLSTTHADNDFPVNEDLFRTNSHRRQNDAFTQQTVFLKTGRQWESVRSSVLFQYADSDKELPTTLNQERDDAELANTSWRLQGLLDYTAGEFAIGHRLFTTREKDLYQDLNSTIGLGTDRIETQLDGIGAFNVASYCTDHHEIVFGLELRGDQIEQQDLEKKQQIVDASRRTTIFAIGDSWTINPDWQLNTTARHYIISDEFNFINRNTEASGDISESSLQLGSQWKINPSLTFKTNAGSLLRIPTLSEKFGSRGLFEGSPELKHEQALTLEAGFEWRYGALQGSTSVYKRGIDDGIVTIFDSRGVGQPQNIAESQLIGFEAELLWVVTDWFEVNANTTLLDSENNSNISSAKGKKLPGIYHQTHGLGLSVQHQQSRFGVKYQRHQELYYNSANGVEADDKTEISVSLTQEWQVFTIDFSARNLLDENFLDLNRYPTPGRSFMTTVTVDF